MNKKVKELWLQALRSGEYKQGYEVLSSDGKHCCLGVLCELAVKAGKIKANRDNYVYEFGGQDSVLPITVMKWAGLKEREPQLPVRVEYSPGHFSSGLTNLNDSGMSFRKIAALIEEHL